MKIHFINSLKAQPEVLENLALLAAKLSTQGHTVNKRRLSKDIVEFKPNYNEEELHEYHRKMVNDIKQADIVIAEISSKSSGLGYEVAMALSERKPVLALYHGAASENSSLSLKSNPSQLIKVAKYSAENLEKIAADFIEDAKNKIDTKFILIISPEIDKYITWAADQRRMHKAQIVRSAVEEAMYKDKEYQQYLKDFAL